MGDETESAEEAYKGIPTVAYIEDMESYMSGMGPGGVESAMKGLEEQHQKYKMVEASLVSRRSRLRGKLPDLEQSLELLEVLAARAASGETTRSRFLLSDQAYATAAIPPTDHVCLWLGANVMLQYSLPEAKALLQKNIAGAQGSIQELTKQLDFLKDQTTTTEVNIARVYNYGVALRKKETPANPAAVAAAS